MHPVYLLDHAEFEIRYTVDGSHDEPAINFFDESKSNVIVHLVSRFRRNTIVFNSNINSHWCAELTIAHNWSLGDELTLILVLDGSQAILRGPGIESTYAIPSGYCVSDIRFLQYYGPVSVRRIDSAVRSMRRDAPLAEAVDRIRAEMPVDPDPSLFAAHFDEQFYREQEPGIDQDTDALAHFCTVGWKSSRDPSSRFSVDYYLQAYNDVRDAGINPLLHYLTHGRAEGRQPNSRNRDIIQEYFDADFYRSQSPRLLGMQALEHYLAFGWRQGLRASREFDDQFYLRLNPDVRGLGTCPLVHYIEHGRREQRSGRPVPQPRMAVDASMGTILFVGHDGAHGDAQLVLLDTVRWFARHTSYSIKVLLLGPGELADQFAPWGETLVVAPDEELTGVTVASFVDEFIVFSYVNTAASARFMAAATSLPQLRDRPLVLHIHERPSVAEHGGEFRDLIDRATQIIAVSRAVKDHLVEELALSAARIDVVHSFLSADGATDDDLLRGRLEERTRLAAAPGTIVVAGCGTVGSRKGSDLFVDTALRVLRRLDGLDIRFVWYGDGADRSGLVASLQPTPFADRITFAASMPDTRRLLAACDIFFLSSREDPFPLEALAAAEAGASIVCFAPATAITEFLGNDAGCVIDEISADKAADALVDLVRSERKRRELGQRARMRALYEYRSEQKVLELFVALRTRLQLAPALSVIVPTFNHEPFVLERLASIANQSFKDIEIILLDDCSTDATVATVRERFSDPRLHIVENKKNSGSPFLQWKLGFGHAKAPYVWIAEGDDYCTLNFLESLLPLVRRDSVALAHARTVNVDRQGKLKHGDLESYLNQAHPTKYKNNYFREGYIEVDESFSHMCAIANVSAVVFRKQYVDPNIIEAASKFKMCGDWLFYISLLQVGAIAYSIEATNFFRRHAQSVVRQVEGTATYFSERFAVAEYVLQNFRISRRALRRVFTQIDNEWRRFAEQKPDGHLADHFDKLKLLAIYEKRSKPRLRIALYVHGLLLSKGGIEKLASLLSGAWLRLGHEVDIYCRIGDSQEPVYGLDSGVRIFPCFDEHDLDNSIARMRRRLAEEGADVFIAMLSDCLFAPVVDAAYGLGFPVIVSEHGDPRATGETWRNEDERAQIFARADGVHLLLQAFVPSLTPELQERVRVIPDGIRTDQACEATDHEVKRRKRIIGVGRLVRQKRFDRLISAFSLLAGDFADWSLVIFGEGPEREALQDLIATTDCAQRISLDGETDRIEDEYAASEIFVVPSEFEGFGIAVLEAKRAGLPAIGFAACNGPNQLIHDGVDGLLVAASADDEAAALAAALRSLMENDEARWQMGIAAKASVDGNSISEIALQWENWLIEITDAHSGLEAWESALQAESGTREPVSGEHERSIEVPAGRRAQRRR